MTAFNKSNSTTESPKTSRLSPIRDEIESLPYLRQLDHFDLPLDRQQISDLLGLTIETVSRQLSQLKRAGHIDLPDRKQVSIIDRARLSELASVT